MSKNALKTQNNSVTFLSDLRKIKESLDNINEYQEKDQLNNPYYIHN